MTRNSMCLGTKGHYSSLHLVHVFLSISIFLNVETIHRGCPPFLQIYIISQHFCVAEKSEKRSRKRKLLKADQLLLPESKIKPVGSKQRKVNKNKRQAENPSDSSASEDEEVKSRPAAVKKNNNHKTVATFDLWKTEGNIAVQIECLFQLAA